MKILLYKGNSLVSKAIQFQTRSEYSHGAIMLSDKTVIEAWHIGGVRHIRTAFDGHSSGTVIDIYRVDWPADFDSNKTLSFLADQLGKGYDFKSVFRFLTRRTVALDDLWFCTELILAATEEGGCRLLNIAPSMASPRDLSISPLMQYEATIHN